VGAIASCQQMLACGASPWQAGVPPAQCQGVSQCRASWPWQPGTSATILPCFEHTCWRTNTSLSDQSRDQPRVSHQGPSRILGAHPRHSSGATMPLAVRRPPNARTVVSIGHDPGPEYWEDVLNKLSDVNQCVETDQVTPASFQVLEIRADGSLMQAVHTPADLGLHSRDVAVVTSKRIHASISPRGSNVIFVNDYVRAIITPYKVMILPCWRRRHMVAVAEAITNRISTHSNNPFENNVLEALLSSSAKHFYSRARQLDLLVNIATSNTQALVSVDLHSMLPLQQTVSESYADVKELQEAVTEVLKDDKMVACICMKPDAGLKDPEVHQTAAVLSSYQLQIQVIEAMFEEMQEQMSNARDITRMQMSAKRNYLVQTNLVISIANLALLNCTIVAGFFGMNLTSGLEDVPGLFPMAVGGAVAASALSFAGIYNFVAWRPKVEAQASIRQLAALRSLVVNHIDDIGDIVSYAMEHTHSGATAIRRCQFHIIAWEATRRRSKTMSQEEVDLLFDFFDSNQNGAVEANEMAAMYEKLSEHPERMQHFGASRAKVNPVRSKVSPIDIGYLDE